MKRLLLLGGKYDGRSTFLIEGDQYIFHDNGIVYFYVDTGKKDIFDFLCEAPIELNPTIHKVSHDPPEFKSPGFVLSEPKLKGIFIENPFLLVSSTIQYTMYTPSIQCNNGEETILKHQEYDYVLVTRKKV